MAMYFRYSCMACPIFRKLLLRTFSGWITDNVFKDRLLCFLMQWWVYGLPVVLLSSAAGAAVMGLSAGYNRHLVQAIKAGAHEYEEIVCQSE